MELDAGAVAAPATIIRAAGAVVPPPPMWSASGWVRVSGLPGWAREMVLDRRAAASRASSATPAEAEAEMTAEPLLAEVRVAPARTGDAAVMFVVVKDPATNPAAASTDAPCRPRRL